MVATSRQSDHIWHITELKDRIEALDVGLFSFIPIQALRSDAPALLALQTAVAATKTPFA